MKKNKLIIFAVLALLVLGGVAFLLFNKSKTKVGNVTLESEGYNVAITLMAPEDVFDYEINNSLPRYPVLKLSDKNKTYEIKANLSALTKISKDSALDSAKKRNEFVEFAANDKTGAPGGYAYEDPTGTFAVRLDLGEKDSYYNLLLVTIKSSDRQVKAKEIYEKDEVKALLASVRTKEYQAPERDYIANANESLKIKKVADRIGDFEITQKSSDNNYLYINGKNDSKELVFSIVSSDSKQDLDAYIASESDVKSGKTTYSPAVDYNGLQVRLVSAPEKVAGGNEAIRYVASKDGVIVRGMVHYASGHESEGRQLLESALKNLTIDTTQIKQD